MQAVQMCKLHVHLLQHCPTQACVGLWLWLQWRLPRTWHSFIYTGRYSGAISTSVDSAALSDMNLQQASHKSTRTQRQQRWLTPGGLLFQERTPTGTRTR